MKKTAKMIKEKTDSTQQNKTAQDNNESGYVIAMTALMLVPMLVMAAFAVDVGSWYSDAARLQRAADAAALAAVVYMPDEEEAWAVALEVAEQNGFISNTGVNNVFVGGGNSTLIFEGEGAIVNIRIEAEGELFFAQAFMNNGDVDLARTSQAEYIEDIKMGNPTSGLGTGNLVDPSDVGAAPLKNDGFWLAINSSCERRANGDQFVAYDGNCSGVVNPIGNLSPALGGGGFNGYTFVMDVPQGATTAELQIRNPGFCDNGYFNNTSNGNREPDLTAWVYGPDTTPLLASDVLDNNTYLLQAPITYDGDNLGAGCDVWQTIRTISQPPGGAATRELYYLRLQADDSVTAPININVFSLRVKPTSVTGVCSSLADSTCPQLYALNWLPIWRPDFQDASGNSVRTAEFFLAEIPAFHEGKVFELTMFDAGERMREIRILNPDGDYVNFDWRQADAAVLETGVNNPTGAQSTWPKADTPPHDDNDYSCSDNAVPYCLDVRDLNGGSNYRFQDHAVQIRIDLDGYACQDLGGGNVNCWWKVEYYTDGAGVTDRTNWSVRIIGDPIRLTE